MAENLQKILEGIGFDDKEATVFLAGANKIAKKPKIYFFEGIGGIKSIYDDSLNSKSEILTFTNTEDIESVLGKKYVDRYVYERARRKISVRGLAPDNPAGKHAQEIGELVLRNARIF